MDDIADISGGAHAYYAQVYYDRYKASYIVWDQISADRTRFQNWMEQNVMQQTTVIFAKRVGFLAKGKLSKKSEH